MALHIHTRFRWDDVSLKRDVINQATETSCCIPQLQTTFYARQALAVCILSISFKYIKYMTQLYFLSLDGQIMINKLYRIMY